MVTTYQRIILVVAGLRHQRQAMGIELEVRDRLFAILATSLKWRRALFHMGCIGHRGLYRATRLGFRVHRERQYNIVEVVLCISSKDDMRTRGKRRDEEVREGDGAKKKKRRRLESEVIKKYRAPTNGEAASRPSRLLGSGMGCNTGERRLL